MVLLITVEGYFILFRNQTAQIQRCPIDPYHIVPDRCQCVDYQVLKLQENPEDVPHGEMPRHVQLYCDRYIVFSRINFA